MSPWSSEDAPPGPYMVAELQKPAEHVAVCPPSTKPPVSLLPKQHGSSLIVGTDRSADCNKSALPNGIPYTTTTAAKMIYVFTPIIVSTCRKVLHK